MANQGSIADLKNDSIDQKVTTNGNGENTGARVNDCLQDIVDTLVGSPVVSDGTPNVNSVFASAAQGLLADSALQTVATDGISITGDGTVANPLTVSFSFGFQGSYDPTVTSLYPTTANTIGGVDIAAGMYWVVDAAGTVNGNPVSPGDGIFALVNNAVNNDDSNWTVFPGLYGGLPVLTVTGLDTDNTDPQNPVIGIAVDGVTITGQGTPADPLEILNAPVLTGNIVYVDIVNGNDLTGAVGDISRPYLTLLAAQTDASVGDTVMVYPGSYTSTQLGRNGINWYFLPGASVTFSTTGWSIPSLLTSQSYNVYGFGSFTSAGGSVVAIGSNGNYRIEAVSITGVTITSSSSVTITSRAITASGGATFSGGVSVINCPSVSFGTGLTISSSTNLTINGNVIGPVTSNTTSTLRINGELTSFAASPTLTMNSGTAIISGNISSTGPSRTIEHVGGSLTVIGSRISRNTIGEVINKTGGAMSLRDCTILANAGSANAIIGSGIVTSYNSHTNKPVTGVTIVGDLKRDSTTSAPAGQVATVLADGTWNWAASAVVGSTLAGNVVIVDAVNGNDSTGVAGDLTKPFLTLLAAQTAASAGQTIVVYPGTYTSSSSLGKNGVNWHFMLGAIVNFTGGSAWSPSTTAVTFKVSGDGEFVCSGFLVQCILLGPNNINIECLNASYTSIDMTNGVVNIKIKGLAQASAETAFFGDSLTFSAAKLQSAVATHVFTQYSNTINIVDTYFELSGIGGACRKNSFGGFFNLRNVYITGGSADSLFANIGGTFYCQNVVSNTGVSPLVVIDGNMQVLSGPATAGQVPTANADGTWSWA